ncbi:MAG: cyclase family protein [Schwartzia sp.]|nr:cyclase family protein [Schwartzia sp. (in: firmicutes)]
MSYRLWEVLSELHSNAYEWVDLTHPLDNESPYWAGIPDGSVELGKTCFDWGNEMLDCLIQTFKFPGQFGTHIDFPGHFIKNAPLSESFGVHNMICPLCVIDITEKVKADVHYAATAEDVKAHEAEYGAIPDGAFVALRTDWSKKWPDMNALSGVLPDGSENFPGWSLSALQYIYETKNAAANGHEALDTDASAEAAKAGDLACERYVLSKGKLQIEVLQNLDRVAPAGALLFAAWPSIKGATGLPVRAFAITPKTK